MIKVEEVHFNFDNRSSNCSAFNICQNKAGHLINAPEWQEAQTSRPVAFARDAIVGAVTIKAKFVRS